MTGPLLAIALAFLLASIPVAAVALAGRVQQIYRRPAADYLRWWGWFAFLILLSAYLRDLVG